MDSATEILSNKERRPSTSPMSVRQTNFELQIEINEKKSDNSNNEVVDVNNLEKEISKLDGLVVKPVENLVNVEGAEDDLHDGGLQLPELTSSKILETDRSVKTGNGKNSVDACDHMMNSFIEKKRDYFDKHHLSNEYEKVTNFDDSDLLFETQTKQRLLKTFKFNANSRFHIKNMKFNYSDVACMNNQNLANAKAKMAFYDTLLNKGGNNLNNKYLKNLKSEKNFGSRSYNKFDNETTNSNLTGIYTNTAETFATGQMESARSGQTKLPGLKRRISGNGQNIIMEKINQTPRNAIVKQTKSTDILNDLPLSKRGEASEYYNNKIRLIAKLIDKHNNKITDVEETSPRKKNSNKDSAHSKKSFKRNKYLDSQSLNSHLTASFPMNPYPVSHHSQGLLPFKTTKLDRQFKRVIHIDHNKRFNSKSSVYLDEKSNQPVAEKPMVARNQRREKSNRRNLMNNHEANSILNLTKIFQKKHHDMSNDESKSANLVKIKFPSINHKNNNIESEEENIFASSSFVKSESAYKDPIRS